MKGRIGFLAADNGGAGQHRSFNPAEALRDQGWDVKASTQANELHGCELVIIHRPVDPWRLDDLRAFKIAGVKVLVQEDDDLEDLPKEHWSNLDEVQLANHRQGIQESDGLIASTAHVQEVYGPLTKQSWVVRNYLPAWIGTVSWARSSRDRESVRVGWAGVTGVHAVDLRWLAPVAAWAMHGAGFTTVGDTRTPGMLGLDGYIHSEVFPYEPDHLAFYKRMSRADIGIVPLKPDESLNLGKSWLKALEYMTLGKPVVVTRLPEQEALVEHGKTGFLADTPKEFAGYVQQLIWDGDLCEVMGAAAKAKAIEYQLERNVGEWETAITEALTIKKPARRTRVAASA